MSRKRGRPSLTPAEVQAQKQRIADVAERLFREEGYAAISMRRLASEAGCAPMTLYAYYPSKGAIMQTIWAGFFAALFDDLERLAAGVADPKERLRTIARAYAAYWIEHPERYVMVYMTHGLEAGDIGAFVTQSGARERFDLFLRTIAVAAPALSPREVKARGELLVSALQGIAHNHITTPAYAWEPAEVLVDTLVDRLV